MFLDVTKKIWCQLSDVNLHGTNGSIWTSKVPMDSLGPGKWFEYDKNWFRVNFEFKAYDAKPIMPSPLRLEFQSLVQNLCGFFYPNAREIWFNTQVCLFNENISDFTKTMYLYHVHWFRRRKCLIIVWKKYDIPPNIESTGITTQKLHMRSFIRNYVNLAVK